MQKAPAFFPDYVKSKEETGLLSVIPSLFLKILTPLHSLLHRIHLPENLVRLPVMVFHQLGGFFNVSLCKISRNLLVGGNAF